MTTLCKAHANHFYGERSKRLDILDALVVCLCLILETRALLAGTMITSVIPRNLLDIYRDSNRDDCYHLVFTHPSKDLLTYSSDRYLPWINLETEQIVKLDLDGTNPEKHPPRTLLGPEKFRWEDSYRKWELEVTAVDAPFHTYEIACLFPEKYQTPILPGNASKFLSDFQHKNPDSALYVKLKWRREDEVTKMYSIEVECNDPRKQDNSGEKYQIEVRKAGKGVRKKLIKARGLKKKKGIVALAKQKLKDWEKTNGTKYVAVLTQTHP